MMKKLMLILTLALAMCLGMAATAWAAEPKTVGDDLYGGITNVVDTIESAAEMGGEAYICVAPVEIWLGEYYEQPGVEGDVRAVKISDSVSTEDLMAKLDTIYTMIYHEDAEILTGDDPLHLTLTEPGTYLVDESETYEDGGGFTRYVVVVQAGDAKAADDKKTTDTKPADDKAANVAKGKFTDVKDGDWFKEPVEWAVAKDVTKGTHVDRFSPYETCTRGQIITFLWRAMGCPEAVEKYKLEDVTDEEYFAEAVFWAKYNEMFEGDTFDPNEPCTRLMAVEFMYHVVGEAPAAGDHFTDVTSAAVDWAYEAGVTTGDTETTFAPVKTCTRGEIVTFLWRAFADAEGK